MANYYVNNKRQSNGDHEVHLENCTYMTSDKKYLGEHSSCDSAVREAKKTYPSANGCKNCCPSCHTS